MARPTPPVCALAPTATETAQLALGFYAFWILPALMQDVHTRIRRVLVPWGIRTRWMLGSQRREERRCEKLTCLPTQGSFPQISQRADTSSSLRGRDLSDRPARAGDRTERQGEKRLDAKSRCRRSGDQTPANS